MTMKVRRKIDAAELDADVREELKSHVVPWLKGQKLRTKYNERLATEAAGIASIFEREGLNDASVIFSGLAKIQIEESQGWIDRKKLTQELLEVGLSQERIDAILEASKGVGPTYPGIYRVAR